MGQPHHTLEFQNICYEVTQKGGKDAGSTKQILHGVSAKCVSGRFTALMGPSGAGKSSLLDILAGVKVSGRAQGDVLVDGRSRKHCRFQELCSYVQQKDVLVPSATVREALVTSALLKLPRSMPTADKLERVDALLTLLELSHVKDSLIGDEALGIKGISGGEKRRVSVGVEVVKDPAIIFLDEPTTGLDSEMALGVTTSLKAVAAAGRMVVATIHQPNSLITDHFDDWALLAQGRLLFSGPWSTAVPYFEAAGYPCPLYRNPTDYFMSLASCSETVEELQQHWTRWSASHQLDDGSSMPRKDQQHIAGRQQLTITAAASGSIGQDLESLLYVKDQGYLLVDGAPASQLTQEKAAATAATEEAVDRQQSLLSSLDMSSSSSSSGGGAYKPQRFGTAGAAADSALTYLYQVWVLMVRFARCWVRTPIMAGADIAQYLVLALFLGLLYLRLPLLLPNSPLDRMGAIFVVLVMLSLTPSYTVLVVWDHERQLLRRETSTNMYSRSAFFLAKTMTTTPIELVHVTVFAVITYYMFGFQATAAKFLIYWVTLVVFALCSETIGYMAAIVTPDSKVGVAVLSIFLLLLLAFSGYLVRTIPVYFAWIPKMSYFSFASNILAENEFAGLMFKTPAGIAVPAERFIPDAIKNGLSLAGNMGVLVGITLGSRLVCMLLLEAAAYWRFL